LDARKSEIYTALFRKDGQAVDRLLEDTVTSAAILVDLLREWKDGSPCLFIGDGADVHKQLLSERLGSRALFQTTPCYLTLAGAVAFLSESRFRSNDVDNLGSLIPVYIRRWESELKQANFALNL
jgi:tRNA threonylcarbamoyladenosine biosynthesis protein TsaB